MADYFDKKRAIATGIASSGAGFGTFIMAPFIYLLDENFGWSWTLMILGTMLLLYIPLFLLFKPIKKNKSLQSSESWNEENEMGEMTNTNDRFETYKCIRIIPTRYISLLYDAKFMILMLSNLLTNIGFSVPFAFTQVRITFPLQKLLRNNLVADNPQDRAMNVGIEPSEASFLLSIIGISSLVGRIGLSAISDHPCINRMYLYTTCLTISGISECSFAYLNVAKG